MEKIVISNVENKLNTEINVRIKKGTTGLEVYLAIVTLIESLLNEPCFNDYENATRENVEKFFKKLETRYFEENKEKFK